MARQKILVTGANGQLGKEIRDLSGIHPEKSFFFQGREDMPLENFEMIRTVFRTIRPDVLINCAAYTAVDQAEQNQALAFQVNAEAVGVMAALCKESGTRFIQVSTDYVFPGNASRPYLETDPTGPINVYGSSKLAGEQQALEFCPQAIIIRTSWVYSSHGKNFVKTMLRLMGERDEVKVVDDQMGCPTYAADLAGALLQLTNLENLQGGIYHYTNAGAVSWYEFARAIAEITRSTCQVKPIPSEFFPTPAKRPAYSVLDCSRISGLGGVQIRPWQDALADCLRKIGSA